MAGMNRERTSVEGKASGPHLKAEEKEADQGNGPSPVNGPDHDETDIALSVL